MKRRISAGLILLALLTFCVLPYHQTVWASDMEAQTEVRLHIDENEKTAAEADKENIAVATAIKNRFIFLFLIKFLL